MIEFCEFLFCYEALFGVAVFIECGYAIANFCKGDPVTGGLCIAAMVFYGFLSYGNYRLRKHIEKKIKEKEDRHE